MSAEGDVPDGGTVGRKNLIVLVALALGILVPTLHIMFIAPYLPNWLNIVIVGAVFWILLRRNHSRKHHWCFQAKEIVDAERGSLRNRGLTRRCSRRLAGLFPPALMIKILQEIATRALARRGRA
jgi:hypothetical protein